MPRYKDEPTAVRVYTVCDESRYLIVRNVPSLGCGDELLRLFATYGDVEECKPMDAEECEAYTDVYWVKFRLITNSRFAKRKLDEYVFLGNRLNISYAPQFETLDDTMEKLECRRNEIMGRSNSGKSTCQNPKFHSQGNARQRGSGSQDLRSHLHRAPVPRVSSDKIRGIYWHMNNYYIVGSCRAIVLLIRDYFPSQSMNQTVRSVREKLNKIQSSSDHIQQQHGSVSKKARVDQRRRI